MVECSLRWGPLLSLEIIKGEAKETGVPKFPSILGTVWSLDEEPAGACNQPRAREGERDSSLP